MILDNFLEDRNYVRDNTINATLKQILPGVNCITKKCGEKYFVLEDQLDLSDTNQILVLPFRPKSGMTSTSGFSDISNKWVFICPLQIKDFVSSNSLNDTQDITGYLGIILLHELSHFSCGVPGNFDEGRSKDTLSQSGEVDFGTEPVVMTRNKKLELKVDSNAVEMIKLGIKEVKGDCFSLCMSIQLAISSAEFLIFGKRIIGEFGSSHPNLLKDKSWTHPNLELRLAFMNYYLNPTEEKRQQIDDYLYERELAPLNLKLIDPRIYQGSEKNISN